MKYTRTTISLPADIHSLGHAQAARYRLSFSGYLARLIEEDEHSGRRSLRIIAAPALRVAKEPPPTGGHKTLKTFLRPPERPSQDSPNQREK